MLGDLLRDVLGERREELGPVLGAREELLAVLGDDVLDEERLEEVGLRTSRIPYRDYSLAIEL